MRQVTHIVYRWDETPGNEGWYYAAFDADGQCVADSMKAFGPVDVDQFPRRSAVRLERALRQAYPDAVVESA